MEWSTTPQGTLSSTDITIGVIEAVQRRCALAQFVFPLTPTGAVGGDTVTFPKIYDLNDPIDGSSLPERGAFPTADYDQNKGTLVMKEYGLGVETTERLKNFAAYDMQDLALTRLQNHMRRKINRLVATAMKQTWVKYTPVSATATTAGTFQTDGSIGLTAGRSLNALDMDTLLNAAVDDWNMPPINGGAGAFDYVMAGSQTMITQIIRDSNIRQDLQSSFTQFGDNSPLLSGFKGIWNRILFLTDTDALSKTMGTTALNGEAVFFGEAPVVGLSKKAPEIRRWISPDGRLDTIAWYMLGGYAHNVGGDSTDILNGQAHVFHITSV